MDLFLVVEAVAKATSISINLLSHNPTHLADIAFFKPHWIIQTILKPAVDADNK